jgi:hypothetical protein
MTRSPTGCTEQIVQGFIVGDLYSKAEISYFHIHGRIHENTSRIRCDTCSHRCIVRLFTFQALNHDEQHDADEDVVQH